MEKTPLEQLVKTMKDFEQETRSKVEESRKEYIKSQAEREAKTKFDRQLLEEIYVMLKTKLCNYPTLFDL